ncbi:radical SAM family heme chaperone HemW [Chryseosolibacter indicus]|uniref:Heme chaperone HemW n=1 Tax=Chryseosolibacter indicus TaxID=2782351 RepID=A0ABS5VPF4_9BACT|nr:radical SAM family heme chaperone HemW [Chryseosolibacter indicus]MBT1702682.1 radical SAM family heme chaperone HemW [Chryseosolibacter indicus]
MAGIYIHIPFCKQACHYCDFHFSTNTSMRNEMVRSIVQELKLQQQYLDNEPIETIYFGGGTPSLLSNEELFAILDVIYASYHISTQPEITLEANPDDLSKDKLTHLYQVGVNRLSVGVQSFNDEILKFLNRAHDGTTATESIKTARDIGFNNISIDLIYAIPGLDNNEWINNIMLAVALKPQHISSYSLTIEPKTAFGNWLAKGRLTAVEDDLAALHLEILVEQLANHGYEQYEVSNFALSGYYSRHNSSYWKQKKYLGVGPSAHSYNGITRQYNVSNNAFYIKSIKKDIVPFQLEQLSRADHINEYLLTTLRTSWGCSLDYLKSKFEYDLMNHHAPYLSNLLENKLAVLQNNHLTLTKSGKLLADKISSDLFFIMQ